MGTIDIRRELEVTEIVFADPEPNAKFKVASLSQSGSGQHFVKINWDGDYAYVKNEDIDNMIAALQKAKELWAE